MKLLFIEAPARCCFDTEGNVYVMSDMHGGIQKRYKSFCDRLTVLQRAGKTYPREEIPAGYYLLDKNIADFVSVPDIYRPVTNLLKPGLRKEVRRIMTKAIQDADRVTIRICMNWYQSLAEEICRELHKPYLIECVETIFDSNWHGDLKGKIRAVPFELRTKRIMRRASYVLYVTEHYLQKRYPTNGKTVSCSNVELQKLDDKILDKRTQHIHEAENSTVIFGTVAIVHKVKGQEYVIRALAKLKAKGITNIEYRLAGSGDIDRMTKLAESLCVADQVKCYGAVQHDKIFDWLDELDVYIHPSFQEGLSRAIIEAMSRALPVTCSYAGGSNELVTSDMLFHQGNVDEIAEHMELMMSMEVREREARKCFAKAHDYEKEKLDKKRRDFYMDFMNNG